MPKLVHKWKYEDLRAWKRALDRCEVELVTERVSKNLNQNSRQNNNSKIKEVRKSKSKKKRSRSKIMKTEKSKLAVEIDVDEQFPRSQYEIVDLEGM